MADEIFEEDPLEYSDSSDVKRTSTKTETDQVTNPQDSFNTTIGSTANDTLETPQDTFTAQATKVYPDTINTPTDQVDIAKAQSTADSYDSGIAEDITTLRYHHETGVMPRIDASKVETNDQALDYFYNELLRRFRFNMYDNMIDAPLHRLEIEDALEDALEEINQYIQPKSNWDLLYFVKKGRRYRRLLLMGAAKNVMLSMVSLGTSNGVEVAIEDFSVQDKTSDFMSLYNELKDVFQEQLTQMKEYDRLSVKFSTFSTGKRRISSTNNSLAIRTSRIIRQGGIIG